MNAQTQRNWRRHCLVAVKVAGRPPGSTHTPVFVAHRLSCTSVVDADEKRTDKFLPTHGFHVSRHEWQLAEYEEIEINVMVGQCLNRRIDSMETVRSDVAAWQQRRDNLQAKANWQFTTTDARIKLKRLYPTICT